MFFGKEAVQAPEVAKRGREGLASSSCGFETFLDCARTLSTPCVRQVAPQVRHAYRCCMLRLMKDSSSSKASFPRTKSKALRRDQVIDRAEQREGESKKERKKERTKKRD